MHVSEADIILYLEAKLLPAERERVETHVGRCKHCAHVFSTVARMPHLLEQDTPVEADVTAFITRASEIVPRRMSSNGWRLFFSPLRVSFATLSLVCVAALGYFLFSPERSQYRSTDLPPAPLTMFPPDGALITDSAPTFRWTNIAPSSAYTFTLMDEGGSPLWKTDTRDTALALPPSVVLVSGKTYLWKVETLLADQSRERPALYVFKYQPPD